MFGENPWKIPGKILSFDYPTDKALALESWASVCDLGEISAMDGAVHVGRLRNRGRTTRQK